MGEFVAEYKDDFQETKEVEETKDVAPAKETKEEVSENPYEVKAREQGWRPKDEWNGNPDDWRDAKEFVQRGELFDKIGKQGNHIKTQEKRIGELEQAIRALGEHNKKIADKEFEKALKTLKSRKIDALEDGDHESVVELDEQMHELKTAKKQAEVPEIPNEEKPKQTQDADTGDALPEDIANWVNDPQNSWYNDNKVAAGAMNAAAQEYIVTNYGENEEPDYKKVIAHAAKEVQANMPHLFENPRRSEAQVGDSSGVAKGKTRSKSKHSVADLTDEQRSIMKTFVDTGVMTQDEYISQLDEIGGIEGV